MIECQIDDAMNLCAQGAVEFREHGDEYFRGNGLARSDTLEGTFNDRVVVRDLLNRGRALRGRRRGSLCVFIFRHPEEERRDPREESCGAIFRFFKRECYDRC